MTDWWSKTAVELAAAIKRREVSAVQVTESVISRINSINGHYNAVVADCSAEAIKTAQSIDNKLEAGKAVGPLAGVPITIKVNIDQQGHATTNGLRQQKDLIAEKDSPVVANLKAADAVIVGRTNTPAFSMRWFTRNSLHGHTLNPLNPTLTPGGSSGGAASAVASGIGAIAHGTDIAGSIRYPAYACGVHGLRPSLGRIPVQNTTAADRLPGGQLMAVSGPLARTIDDVELGFKVMAGFDNAVNNEQMARDPWWVPVPYQLAELPRRAALVLNPDGYEVDASLIKAMQDAAAKLVDAGWEVVETSCPSFSKAAELNINLWMAEMASMTELVKKENDPDANFVYEQLLRCCQSEPAADFLTIMQQRATLTREWQLFLHQYPLLICPPSGETPFADQLDVESEQAFDRVFKAQLTQIGLPLMGIPGLAVTTGIEQRDNAEVPVGVQLIASRYREDWLLQAGRLIENKRPAVDAGGSASNNV